MADGPTTASASASAAKAGNSADAGESEPDVDVSEASAPPRDPGAKAPPSTLGRTSQSGPDPLIGRVINDRFRIVSMVARGGMGKVYRAEQAPLGREVALKVLNPNYNGDNDPEFHKRFFLEASTCSKLTHPNTVTIFDYGRTDDDVYYIAMELLEGRTLHRALREEGPFTAERALGIARQICRSLREAHGLGVIHRDLKPANVYLVRHGDESDFVKVLDFGLVKNVDDKGEDLTQTGLFMGSPKYMSPEQIRGERADARADIYSLGVMLYEMVTGKVPFDRPNSVNILMAHVHEAPPAFADINPSAAVPEALELLVRKCLAKQPDERFASMEELLAAMKTVGTPSGELGTSGERSSLATGQHHSLRSTGSGPVSASTVPSLTPSGVVMAPGAIAPNATLGSGTAPSSGPTTLGAPSEAPPAPSRAPMFVTLALGVVVIGGLVWYAAGGAGSDPGTDTVVRPETPTDTPSEGHGVGAGGTEAHVPPPTSAVEAHTLVTLESTPAGAMVDVGEHTYGPTPAHVEWTGEDAAPGREVTFVFRLAGRRDYSIVRTVTGDTLDVSAVLEALPTDRPFRPRPARRPEGDDGTGTVGPVKGYKLDPY